ncbi:MAG: hypothetical protein MI861_00615, partial [Pirellulales bacterium]|nr:hypothetical protein [Pirellulales bacterium]
MPTTSRFQRWLPALAVPLSALAACLSPAPAAAQWTPAEVTIQTPWAEDVAPDNAWPEYPRPQMVRSDWTNLNGLWDYAITPLGRELPPGQWDGKILVPYALESSLSGVGKRLESNQALWYQRTFELGEITGRLLLNFEAVDHTSTVWVNGERVGENVGGNLPFGFDITDAIKPGQNTITLRVEDFTDDRGKYQLRGKQKRDVRGIWYTPVSGIWQTVWLEPVPEAYIASLKIDTQIDPAIVSVQAHATGRNIAGQSVRVTIKDGDEAVAR